MTDVVFRSKLYEVRRPAGNVLEITRLADGREEQILPPFAAEIIGDLALDEPAPERSPHNQLWADEILGCYFSD